VVMARGRNSPCFYNGGCGDIVQSGVLMVSKMEGQVGEAEAIVGTILDG